MFLLIENYIFIEIDFLFFLGVLEEFLVKLVFLEDNFDFDVFLISHDSFFDVSLFEFLLDFLFQDLFFPFENLFFPDFSDFLLLFSFL